MMLTYPSGSGSHVPFLKGRAKMSTKEHQADHDQREVLIHQSTSTSRRQLLRLLGVGGIAGVAGCSADDAGTATGTKPATDTETGTATATGKEQEKNATIGVPGDITSDYNAVWGGISPYYTRILEPLVWAKQDFQVEPWLAKDWKRTGEKTWEFSLRENVTFHNGKPLNAESVIFSFKAVLEDKGYFQSFISLKPSGLKKVDDLTVEFTTTKPRPQYPKQLSHLQTAIQHPDRSKDGGAIGTGPYKLKDIKSGQFVTVSAAEGYWKDAAQMETLKFRVISDDNTRALTLVGNKIDVGMSLPPSQFKPVKDAEDTDAVKQNTPTSTFLVFRNGVSPTSDVKLRKALNYAVSQKKIVDGAENGIGLPSNGFVPRVVWWSAHDTLPKYGPDKAKAKELVNQSEYDGETLQLILPSDPWVVSNPKLVGSIVKQAAKDIGVSVEVKIMGDEAFDKTEESTNKGHLFLIAHATFSASTKILLDVFTPSGSENIATSLDEETGEQLESLLNKGLSAKDKKTTKEAWKQSQHIVVEENAFIIPLFDKQFVAGMHKNIEFDFHPISRNSRFDQLKYFK